MKWSHLYGAAAVIETLKLAARKAVRTIVEAEGIGVKCKQCDLASRNKKNDKLVNSKREEVVKVVKVV
jgi:hypothetical protein